MTCALNLSLWNTGMLTSLFVFLALREAGFSVILVKIHCFSKRELNEIPLKTFRSPWTDRFEQKKKFQADNLNVEIAG